MLREIRDRSVREGLPAIAVGRFDGLHLEVIARAIGALKAVEIGTLGGYSGVCLLRGMGVHGVLHTFEYSPKHAKVASDSFHKAGVAARAQSTSARRWRSCPRSRRRRPSTWSSSTPTR